jgi:predicted GIY-YIG superfamily endonuclease
MSWEVYHIFKIEEKDDLNKGYIGVSEDVPKRFQGHSKSKYYIGNAKRYYNLNITDNCHVLKSFDNSDDAYDLENKLRPTPLMGWNIEPGGKGYTKGHKSNPWMKAKISETRKRNALNCRNTDEFYQELAEKQRGIKRPILECSFCGKSGGYGNMQRWHFANCKMAPKIISKINSYDCDGVITLGITPPKGGNDVIITGRSFEERENTLKYFARREIENEVFFSPWKYEEKTRKKSGIHKGNTIWELFNSGILVQAHFDDDFDQIKEIRKIIKFYGLPTVVIFVNHFGTIDLENCLHDEFGNVTRSSWCEVIE